MMMLFRQKCNTKDKKCLLMKQWFKENPRRTVLCLIGIAALTAVLVFSIRALVIGIEDKVWRMRRNEYNEQLIADIHARWEVVEKGESLGTLRSQNLIPGKTVFFGKYDQDNKRENGEEPIEWIVLDRSENPDDPPGVMLISKEVLAFTRFGESEYENTRYEDSNLRQWLNGKFLDKAFCEEEQSMMVPHTVSPEPIPLKPWVKYDFGADTHDKVFVLNVTEGAKYLTRRGTSLEYDPKKVTTWEWVVQKPSFSMSAISGAAFSASSDAKYVNWMINHPYRFKVKREPPWKDPDDGYDYLYVQMNPVNIVPVRPVITIGEEFCDS